jgi:hypothetical protein
MTGRNWPNATGYHEGGQQHRYADDKAATWRCPALFKPVAVTNALI